MFTQYVLRRSSRVLNHMNVDLFVYNIGYLCSLYISSICAQRYLAWRFLVLADPIACTIAHAGRIHPIDHGSISWPTRVR